MGIFLNFHFPPPVKGNICMGVMTHGAIEVFWAEHAYQTVRPLIFAQAIQA